MEKQEIIDRLKIEVYDLNDAMIQKDAMIKEIQKEMTGIQKEIGEKLAAIKQIQDG